MNQAEFPNGFFAKEPAETAPDFVKGRMNIKLDEAIGWLQTKQKSGEEWVSLDIKESQGGKWYAAVNTWKPKGKNEFSQGPTPKMEDDDLPW